MKLRLVLRPLGTALSSAALRALWLLSSTGRIEGPRAFVCAFEKRRVLKLAESMLGESPGTVTTARCDRSAGGRQDYFSEGDYWWPDPNDPAGPYVQRDGMSNPDNFSAHRHAMVRLSRIVAALTAAHRLTRDARYAEQAVRHLEVWFLDERTRMNPHLLYGQAIKGRATGREFGVIDTIHLVEVAQSIRALERANAIGESQLRGLKAWFSEYLKWITTHPFGQGARKTSNNHATCWLLQAAAFAKLVDDQQVLADCRESFENKVVADQVAADGSFPRELARSRPYSYSLFNLDVMGIAAHVLSLPDKNMWTVENDKGGSLKKAVEFHFPFIADKRKWPHKPDVTYFGLFPLRLPVLLFAAIALDEPKYVDLWRSLDGDPTHDEANRNFPVRQPVLWVDS